MKIALYVVGGIVLVLLLVFGLQILASERVEVVELETTDAAGKPVVTRLWVVDFEGSPYLRAGRSESGWYSRVRAHSDIRVTRNGETRNYRGVARPELADTINDLMQDKYTWGDDVIGVLIGGHGSAIPVELVPR